MLALAAASLTVVTACSSPGSQVHGDQHGGGGQPSSAPGVLHVHGLTREASDGKIYLATHTGLYRYEGGTTTRISPDIDLMGFTAAGPRHYYASGHPGEGVDLSQPVGLIESRDGGRSWKVLSRGGESDFHALTANRAGVLGFDGEMRVSKDGTSWARGAAPGDVAGLAAAPHRSTVLAATLQGVFTSADDGMTWAKAPGAPLLTMLAWADNGTAAGVTTDGAVAVSVDAGRTWKVGAARLGSPAQAISAGRASDGRLEVLVATEDTVEATTDSGATLTGAT